MPVVGSWKGWRRQQERSGKACGMICAGAAVGVETVPHMGRFLERLSQAPLRAAVPRYG